MSAELVALHVFRHADEDGRFISMEYTRERIPATQENS